jgi:CcmD family protein
MTYLVLAYAVIWLALFAYLMYISAKQADLKREIEALKKLLEERRSP